MSIINTPLFQRLLERSPFSEYELIVLIATAPDRYKTHLIDKRGGRGKREISQPTKEIKFLQRLLVREELANLVIHDAAIAYRPGMGIRDHAQPHAEARYLLKLDFKDFFPSLKFQAIEHRLSKDCRYSSLERWILGNLLCRKVKGTGVLQLSIGAPSSPLVSNYLLREFDERAAAYCKERDIRYTRYADDLAFSTSKPGELNAVEKFIRGLVFELEYLALVVNEKKTVNVSTKRKRTLVGLTLSNEGRASIGREAKRELRAALKNWTIGKLNPTEFSRMKGRLAFTYAIDPDFVISLLNRHGFASLAELERY
jgi:RNA-directed DNA polymerase